MSDSNRIRTTRGDVAWSYIGTLLSLGIGFIQLPFIILYLSADELGLWYSFVAVSGLVSLFEFGFSPTFARNIVYVMSGARRLQKMGYDRSSVGLGIDWHLLNTVIVVSRRLYAIIATIALVVSASFGSLYVGYISRGIEGTACWWSWAIFCVAIFFNLFFLHYLNLLQGIGDVEGLNKARTVSRIVQFVLTVGLLFLGLGLVGASIGYLSGNLLLRLFCAARLSRHSDVREGLSADKAPVTKREMREVFDAVFHLAWRDGAMEICVYASTNALTIVCSLLLSLEQTGIYSVSYTVANAVVGVSAAYPASRMPAHQSACISGDVEGQKRIVADGAFAFLVVALVCVSGAAVIVLPLLSMVRGSSYSVSFFVLLSVYLLLWRQHSNFAVYILDTNEMPYMSAYLVSAIFGTAMAVVITMAFGLGEWGIVLGPMVINGMYNNWKWPRYVARSLGTTYYSLLCEGFYLWRARIAVAISSSSIGA